MLHELELEIRNKLNFNEEIKEPFFSGNGNHSVKQLEEICQQYKEYSFQQALIKQKLFDKCSVGTDSNKHEPRVSGKFADEVINCIPTNWLDPMLSGKNAIIPKHRPYYCNDIENLLRAIKERVKETIEFMNEQETQNLTEQSKGQMETRVMLTLEEIENKRDYKTVFLIIATLANLCAATEERIIDLLTGYLWDEEEAEQIKRSA